MSCRAPLRRHRRMPVMLDPATMQASPGDTARVDVRMHEHMQTPPPVIDCIGLALNALGRTKCRK